MVAADTGPACKESVPEAEATYRGNRLAPLVETDPTSYRRFNAPGLELERAPETHGVPAQGQHLDVEPVPMDIRTLQRLPGTPWNEAKNKGPCSPLLRKTQALALYSLTAGNLDHFLALHNLHAGTVNRTV